jgi:hypothetical protein
MSLSKVAKSTIGGGKPTPTSKWLTLPNVLLAMIFSNFSLRELLLTIERVGHGWRSASTSLGDGTSGWHSLDTRDFRRLNGALSMLPTLLGQHRVKNQRLHALSTQVDISLCPISPTLLIMSETTS